MNTLFLLTVLLLNPSVDTNVVLHYYHGGGMYYGSQDYCIRYDSVVVEDMDHGLVLRRAYAMNDQLRKEVKEAIGTYRLNSIRTLPCGIIYDKATTSVKLTRGTDVLAYVSSGATTQVIEADRDRFHAFIDWMMNFIHRISAIGK